MTPNKPSQKVSNRLVVLSSAAVLAVYSAGYFRTRSAADQFALEAAERRPPVRIPQAVAAIDGQSRPLVPVTVAPDRSAPVPPTDQPGDRVLEAKASQPPPSPSIKRDEEAKPEKDPAATVQPATPASSATEPVTAPVMEQKPAGQAPVSAPVPTPPPPAPLPPPAPAAVVWKDGTYLGWGSSRHGDIEAKVVIENGRIASATISQCRTRYSCSVIDKLPPQVAQRQSPETDFVSGATQSTNAFYYGVVEALSKAK